jgi:hypothetical protein
LRCQFCAETTREHDLSDPAEIQWLTGLILTHLVESHWEKLTQLRALRVAMGGNARSYDAWKRL